jgi:MoxR-like ATPase
MVSRHFVETCAALQRNVERTVFGKSDAVRLALCCLLSEGHLLIEDVPGTAKTTLAKSLAASFGGTCQRVQFTPDMLPSDITGVMVYDPRTTEFRFRPGPAFANIVIADEINRASPKTQAAMLEVMEERQVTVDGQSRPVPRPFLVVATQNPTDFAGTFPLPDVQLDRFMMRLHLGYPERSAELEVLMIDPSRTVGPYVDTVIDVRELSDMVTLIDGIEVSEAVASYALSIAVETRRHPDLRLGVSTRGILALLRAARSFAATEGRSYVIPDDVKYLAGPVLMHRLCLTPEAELRDRLLRDVFADIVAMVDVPRRARLAD